MSVPPTLSVGWPISSRVVSFLSHLALRGSPTGIDLVEPGADRTGPAIVEGYPIELLDVRHKRPGSRRLRDGEVETFDRHGSRTGMRREAAARRR